MTSTRSTARSALRFLLRLSEPEPHKRNKARRPAKPPASAVAELATAGLIAKNPDGRFEITETGRAFVARARTANSGADIDPFLGQHLLIGRRAVDGPSGRVNVTVDDAESPLAWLACRKGRDGRSLLEPQQVLAGERLRAEFTRAHLMPRITSNWQAAVAHTPRGAADSGAGAMTDAIVSARQRVRQALASVGPKFSGLLVDVCCFLKRLEDVERERVWPPRSAKVVLQLALGRLARHYGLAAHARGYASGKVLTWLASEAPPSANAD